MVIQSYSGEIVGRVEKRGLAEVEYSEYGCQPNSRARTGAIGATGSGSLPEEDDWVWNAHRSTGTRGCVVSALGAFCILIGEHRGNIVSTLIGISVSIM